MGARRRAGSAADYRELYTETNLRENFLVNPTGKFEIGGPMGDAGLTGRKIIVDTYGGAARHGGGAFSGKDPSKVDRSAAYAARYVAKNVVAAGLADRCEVQVAYAIGVAHPLSLMVETFGTEPAPERGSSSSSTKHFDLRPGAIVRDLDLRRPIFQKTAAYGHFGREDPTSPGSVSIAPTRFGRPPGSRRRPRTSPSDRDYWTPGPVAVGVSPRPVGEAAWVARSTCSTTSSGFATPENTKL